jgi:hypothetical protein
MDIQALEAERNRELDRLEEECDSDLVTLQTATREVELG